MTIQDILNLDVADVEKLAKEDPKQLRRMTSQLRSAATKRALSLAAADISTPSLAAVKKGGSLNTVAGRNITSVKSQFGKLKQFLESGQSTVKQAKQFQSEVLKSLGIEDLTKTERTKFWEVWEKLKEDYGYEQVREISSKVATYLRDMMVDNRKDKNKYSADEYLAAGKDYMKEQYEAREWKELEEMGGGLSGFFDR